MPKGKVGAKRRRPQDEIIWYALRVTDWNFDYHFGLASSRWDEGPYSEYRHLELSGVPIRPSKLKAERAVLDVMADPKLAGHGKDSAKTLVGMLDLTPDTVRGHVWVPPDVLPLLLQLLTANELRYAVMRGGRLRYRKANLRDCRFCRTLDEVEDLPDDE